ncbi:MAG: redoxin family protein [Candidatus Micrarchaeota archaeon]|nr:redoxin family protein [Candidatus Micrarchaeota archaeon]MDE1847347.1 redoxin family protein [Candidatus Micrarchaeota archaeon]MDE1863962.1 redoxin family protein [Candidatus Micrarchaeota archaeon]
MKFSIYIIAFGIIGVLIVLAALSTLFFNVNPEVRNVSLSNLPNGGPAPNIQGISHWINSQPLNISSLKGKVVLVDFWTYSCINCIRTIPYLNAWYAKYHSEGLVIIGVHTPEFAFEHNYTNVANAVKKFGILYPVAMDNNYSTWLAYQNNAWPADYLIDKNGDVRYAQIGEGNYNQTEKVIQELLENAGYNVSAGKINVTSTTNFSGIRSPETYFGYFTSLEHQTPNGNTQKATLNGTTNYILPNSILVNTAYLSGEWYSTPDSIVAVNNSKIIFVYDAKNVDLVAAGNSSISIFLNGTDLPQSYYGADDRLVNGTATVTINASRLYNVIAGPSYGIHEIEIDAKPGFRMYTFTFG